MKQRIKRKLKQLVPLAIVLLVAYYLNERTSPDTQPSSNQSAPSVATESRNSRSSADELTRAFEQRLTSHQVRGDGTVVRVLSDDNEGSRHQRFVLRLESGQSLMVAHNIDLAPRIASIREGDRVAFYGEYEWNERGGVIHWTHHDPNGRHVGGWLEHDSRRYQ